MNPIEVPGSTCRKPVFGSSRPMISRRMVVFPDPFGPTSATFSPAPMVNVTSSRAWKAPKDFLIPVNVISAMLAYGSVRVWGLPLTHTPTLTLPL
ncbi:MAG TPA: hypothetical protein VFI02_11890 [Armatimonadota bacterium]|nr:hypothetical protein [Armatimonadota bacterium]